ncbi:hypothetical protein M2266_003618 [Streptomyces sp. SPB162]|nr:hypothetical protein [Streptomyces sp. SPB162]
MAELGHLPHTRPDILPARPKNHTFVGFLGTTSD